MSKVQRLGRNRVPYCRTEALAAGLELKGMVPYFRCYGTPDAQPCATISLLLWPPLERDVLPTPVETPGLSDICAYRQHHPLSAGPACFDARGPSLLLGHYTRGRVNRVAKRMAPRIPRMHEVNTATQATASILYIYFLPKTMQHTEQIN